SGCLTLRPVTRTHVFAFIVKRFRVLAKPRIITMAALCMLAPHKKCAAHERAPCPRSQWVVAGLTPSWGGKKFSHINADGLVQFGKAVVQNAAPFAVGLALQVWAPANQTNS
ncbi:hypothetical protein BCU36_025410, partial [Vibrio lentus]